jgi:hypothetical protein
MDDLIQLHEQAGTTLAVLFNFSPALGLRAKDFGEILFAAACGVIAVALVLATLLRGHAHARRISLHLLTLLCLLAFFAVFFDALHTIAFFNAPKLAVLLTLIEDGGEMLIVSAITVYTFDVAIHRGQPSARTVMALAFAERFFPARWHKDALADR